MVGYAKNPKAWRVLILHGYGSWKVLESENVKFEEGAPGPLLPSVQPTDAAAEPDLLHAISEDVQEETSTHELPNVTEHTVPGGAPAHVQPAQTPHQAAPPGVTSTHS